MKNFQFLIGRVNLLFMTLVFIFSSCNIDDENNESISSEQDLEVQKNVIRPNVDKVLEAILDEGKAVQEHLSLDDEFLDLYTSVLEFSMLPVLLNSGMGEEELIATVKNADAQNLSKLYHMSDKEFDIALDELVARTIKYTEKMNRKGISPEKLGNAIIELESSKEFQNKISANYQKLSVASCASFCTITVFGCSAVVAGGAMRKWASCMRMPLNSTERYWCTRGVILEQSGQGIVCIMAATGCIYGCLSKGEGRNLQETIRSTQYDKNLIINRARGNTPAPKPSVLKYQQNFDHGLIEGHRQGRG